MMLVAVQLVGLLATAAAAYGGVRVGLKSLETRVARVEQECDAAHRRIDRVLEGAR